MSRDPHLIETVEALREVVGETVPGIEQKNQPVLDAYAVEFLSKVPFLVLATGDAEGNLDASPKGDGPGFVVVEDERTLLIPDRPGNKLVYGHLNILENPRVGILFMIPGTGETLRVNGRAELTRDPAALERLAARGRPAVLAIRIHVDECFFHCAKAFIRSKLWQPDAWPAKHRVSFGEMFARRVEAGDDLAEKIDESVERGYREDL